MYGRNRPNEFLPTLTPSCAYSVIFVSFRYHRAVPLKMSVCSHKVLEPEYKSMYCFLHQRSLVSGQMSAGLNSVLRDIIDLHSGQNFLLCWGLVTVCRLTASLWMMLSSPAVQYVYVAIKLGYYIVNSIVSSFFITVIGIGQLYMIITG